MTLPRRSAALPWAGLLLVCIVLGGLKASVSTGPVREIQLVVRGMAFYLAHDPKTPNPVLDVRPGETVRVVLTNEERGILHDFAVPELSGAAVDLLRWNERGVVTITAPDAPGRYEYVCRPHRAMMKGVLRIVAPPADS